MGKKIALKLTVLLLVIPALLITLLSSCADTQPTTVVPTTTASQQMPTTTQPTQPTQPTTQPTQPTTQPTQPTTQPTQPTQPPEPPNPVPEHLRDNYYLTYKDQGACDRMTGNIKVLVVFVNDSISRWNSEDMESAKVTFAEHEARMEKDAAKYGAEMDMTMEYLQATISVEFTFKDGKMTPAYLAMQKVGLADAFYDQDLLESQYNADSVPVLFVLNRDGRAYAVARDKNNNGMECAVIYGKDLSSVRHEICHIYGAEDFYFPDATVAAMNKYLPTSLMYNHYNDVDDLTAFLIGWVDTLSANARSFLEETNHLTRDEIEDARKDS